MDIASIEKLIALVEASGIGELEIAEGASSVRISRVITSPTAVGPSAEPAAVVQPQPAMPIPAVQAPVIAPAQRRNTSRCPRWWEPFISHRGPVRRHLWLSVSRSTLAILCVSLKR
jgi:hypothetical protein